MNSTRLFSKLGLLLLAAASAIAIGVSSLSWKGVRFDLTENRLYTLSQGSHNILAALEAPITLRFYFSVKETEGAAPLRNYGQRIQSLLQEYAQLAGVKIDLHIIDPEPFSPEEDAADADGLRGVRLRTGGDEFFLGLVGQRENGLAETIPFFHPDREDFLEQDISKLIFAAGRGRKPVVGILSSLDVNGGVDLATRRPTPSWASIAQLQNLYTVRTLSTLDAQIAADIDLLLLIQPGTLPEAMQYAIDQYVVRGGNTMVFADPVSDSAAQQRGPTPLPEAEAGIERLLTHWGVKLHRDKIIGDARHAVSVGRGDGQTPIRHLAIQSYDNRNLVGSDITTENLETVIVASTGNLEKIDGSSAAYQPLLVSSNEAMPLPRSLFEPVADPAKLYEGFQPSGDIYTLAARISGQFDSAFPDGYTAPSKEEKNEDDSSGDEQSENTATDAEETKSGGAEKLPPHQSHAEKSASLIVVADSDILSDRLWVRVQNFLGQQIARPFADNGDFLLNATDNLLGNADLISIRSRGRYARPFTVVEELRREADARFQNTERALTNRLQAAEDKLAELQQQKSSEEDQLALNDEQRAEIEKFQAQKLQTRKELRDVRHQLGGDIESLGSWLKFINIALMPILLTVGALLFRARRRIQAMQ